MRKTFLSVMTAAMIGLSALTAPATAQMQGQITMPAYNVPLTPARVTAFAEVLDVYLKDAGAKRALDGDENWESVLASADPKVKALIARNFASNEDFAAAGSHAIYGFTMLQQEDARKEAPPEVVAMMDAAMDSFAGNVTQAQRREIIEAVRPVRAKMEAVMLKAMGGMSVEE